MIQGRNSDQVLTCKTILTLVSDYDIYKLYCTNFTTDARFCSDLRVDRSPTVKIYEKDGRLWYRDYGELTHSFDSFGYVQKKFNISLRQALEKISEDFGLGLTGVITTPIGTIHKEQPIILDNEVEIQIRSREWKHDDLNFWGQFNIDRKILELFKVIPLEWFWVNGKRYKAEPLSYAYIVHGKIKIYQPYSNYKFFNAVPQHYIQGDHMLPASGDLLIITSSLKDAMSLYSIDLVAVAPNSETTAIHPSFIDYAKKNFNYVAVFYDNDFQKEDNPGQKFASKIVNDNDFINICIPSAYKAKDISDFIRDYSAKEALQIIKQQLPWQLQENLTKTIQS